MSVSISAARRLSGRGLTFTGPDGKRCSSFGPAPAKTQSKATRRPATSAAAKPSVAKTKSKRQAAVAPTDKAARAKCRQYVALFGLELGPAYFVEGLTLDQAREAFRSRPAYAERLDELAIDAGLGAIAALALFTESTGCFARGQRSL